MLAPTSAFLAPPPPPPQGVALIFISGGGQGLPPGPPPPLPLDPLPPSPLRSNSPENQGSGNLFRLGQCFPPVSSAHQKQGSLVTPQVSFFPSVAGTMSQRPISTFFGTPVQPCSRTKRDNVVNTILYFSRPRWMDWEQKARGIQCRTGSMFHSFSEHSNGNSVRVYNTSSHNGTTRPRGALPAASQTI